MNDKQALEISHHPIPGRFAVEVEGETAHLDYEMADGVMHITDVQVDPEPGPVDWEEHGKASPAEQRAIRAAHGLTPRLVPDPPVRHTTP